MLNIKLLHIVYPDGLVVHPLKRSNASLIDDKFYPLFESQCEWFVDL